MPILHPRGLITPGQLGPTRRDFDWLLSAFTTYRPTKREKEGEQKGTSKCCSHTTRRNELTRISSAWGMPSVMQTIKPISFSIASIMASAALGGGTYNTDASGWVS